MHSLFFFFLNDTATTEIYTLSLHDALPICRDEGRRRARQARERAREEAGALRARLEDQALARVGPPSVADAGAGEGDDAADADRKSTRLNSSHSQISYAVFCLKKKKELNYTSSLAPSSPASCENTSDTSNVYGHQGSS